MKKLNLIQLENLEGGGLKDVAHGYCSVMLGGAVAASAAGLVMTGPFAVVVGISIIGCAVGGYY